MKGAKAVIVLVVFLFHLCTPASLHPLSHSLPNAHLQANTEYIGKKEGLNNDKSSENIIPHHGTRLERAFGSRGVAGGQVAGTAGDDHGGGSQSNNPRGGAAVIPVYAAGAAHGQHKNHHNAGSCMHLSIGSSTLAAVILAYLLLINPCN